MLHLVEQGLTELLLRQQKLEISDIQQCINEVTIVKKTEILKNFTLKQSVRDFSAARLYSFNHVTILAGDEVMFSRETS
jgi:hypothetical protein